MIDINCETWHDVVKWLEHRRAGAANAVLAFGVDERKADYHRGIHAILIELAKLPATQTETGKRDG